MEFEHNAEDYQGPLLKYPGAYMLEGNGMLLGCLSISSNLDRYEAMPVFFDLPHHGDRM